MMEDINIYHVFPIDEQHVLECETSHGGFDDGSYLAMTHCNCKCMPTHKYEGDALIVVHNSFDGREGVEWVNEILNNVV